MASNPTSNKAPVAVLEYEPSAFELALLKHKTKLILVGVIAVVGTAGYWGYRLYKEETHKSAAVDFTRAQTVEDLKKVAAGHPTQVAGGDATILAAEYVSVERPKEAIAMLQGLLSKMPNHPLAPLVSWRIAEYNALAGDAAGAEKEYEAVAKAGTPFSSFALLRLGDLKWAAGDTAKAQEFYDRILATGAMAGSPVRAVAKKRVEFDLKAKPPALVEYKEEPPPPTPGAPNSKVPGLGDIPGLSDINNIPGAATGDSLLPPPLLPKFSPEPVPVPEPTTPPAPVTPPDSTVPKEAPPATADADAAPKPPAEASKPAPATPAKSPDSKPETKKKK